MEPTTLKSDFRVEPLDRATLQEGVYNQVASLILDGGIVPGQLVTIQALAEAFGVSAMPVREALKRLTAANALTVVSGRSIGIPPLTMERLTDLRNVRREIEGAATAWAAGHADEGLVTRLSEHIDRMERATKSGDTETYLQANRMFHFSIYRSAGSPTLYRIIENLWLQIGPYLNLLRESGNYDTSSVHHRAAMEALANRDPDAARNAIVRDIEDAYTVLSTVLK